MYILECADRSLYVGSTRDLEHRLAQGGDGEGALYTQTRLRVRLLYFEEFDRVDDAYRREKQIQGWGRGKRLALVKEQLEKLPGLSRKQFGSKVTPIGEPRSGVSKSGCWSRYGGLRRLPTGGVGGRNVSRETVLPIREAWSGESRSLGEIEWMPLLDGTRKGECFT